MKQLPREKTISISRRREEHTMAMQRCLAAGVGILLSVSSIASLSIFFLQGFHVSGFNLSESLMHWIGAMTIGSLGGLTTIVYRAFFPNPPT